jgi:hypothetical protein
MFEYFKNWERFDPKNNKIKEINDLVCTILFSKGDNNKFYPTNISAWKDAAINKLKYMSDKIYKDNYVNEINAIKIIFNGHIKKEVLITKSPVINVKFYMGMVSMSNNIIPKLKVKCTKAMYNKLVYWIKDKKSKNGIVFITLLRYNYNLRSGNHQLGVIYDNKLLHYDVELFASPFNRSLKEFCSLYPDIDKYYEGSLGSFYKYKLESHKKYTMNPPYVDSVMTKAAKKITEGIINLVDVTVHITIPIWDCETLKEMNSNILCDIDVKYDAYDILKKSPYVTDIKKKFIGDYKYIDHLSGKNISVANTFVITMNKNTL